MEYQRNLNLFKNSGTKAIHPNLEEMLRGLRHDIFL